MNIQEQHQSAWPRSRTAKSIAARNIAVLRRMEDVRAVRLANIHYFSPEGRQRDQVEARALRAGIMALKEKHEIRED